MASATTDTNSSLPDSSVDLLTGQAMSEVYGDLSKFAADPDFAAKLNVPFGENWDAAAAKALAEAWFQGDFSDIPPVKVVSSAEIGGANGAFAAATDTIYLSKEFLAGNAGNPAAIADVLREEIGHSVDARLNVTDSPGDEGAIFAAVVQGKELTQGELQGLKSKDDTATVLLGGEDTTIEMNQQQWRVWRYTDPRGKNSDFWLKPDGSSDQNGSRSDGKDGININWGQGSPFDPPNTDIVNKLDYFATSGATQATFEAGKSYNFRVSADDALIMAARQIGKSNFDVITPLSQDRKQFEWQTFPNGIFKEYSWTPSQSGQYYVYFWHYDRTGDANLNISWEKVNGSSYISGLSSLTDDQWDRQSGDGNQFNDNNRDSGRITEIDESLPDVKQVSKDLSTALFGKILSLDTGYAYDYTNGNPGGDPYNGSTKAHAGIDYRAGVGQEVSAIVGGTVKKVTDYGSIGKFVTVESFDGRRWIYGHIQNSKQEGQGVSQGEKIGTVVDQVNNQGNNTHFHLEVDSPPFNDSIIGGINRLNKDQSNLSFVRQNTMSPLQAYWKYRNNIKE
ncbi:M23 family metallopeptidase [Microcoleus sp. herbarium12]